MPKGGDGVEILGKKYSAYWYSGVKGVLWEIEPRQACLGGHL